MNRIQCEELFEQYVDHFCSYLYRGESLYPVFCQLAFTIMDSPYYSDSAKIWRLNVLRDAMCDSMWC